MSEPGKGVTMEDILALKKLLEQRALLHGEKTLSSGIRTSYYFDLKRVTLEPEGKDLIRRILEPIVRAVGAEAVGGLETGAIPMAGAIPMSGFIVRDEKKGHGTKEKIAAAYSIHGHGDEGEIRAGCRVAILDDVVTSGDSIERAIAAVKASDCELVRVVALITRPEANAAQNLGQKYDYVSLFECDYQGNLSLTARVGEFVAAGTKRVSHRCDCLHLAETAASAAHSKPPAAGRGAAG